MKSNNYDLYEISNFSKSNFHCRHNIHYWEIDPYLGFGPSAHSFDIKYRWNREIREGMQTFWNSIDDKQKVDITKYAHWTGTGLVWYGNEPKINLL